MKNLPLLTLFLLTVISAFGQETKVNWSEKNASRGLMATNCLIHIDGSSYYATSENRSDFSVSKFDFSHNLIEKYDLEYLQEKELIIPTHTINLNDEVYAYSYLINKKEKTRSLFISEFNGGNLTEPKLVYSHPYKRGLLSTLPTLDNFFTIDNEDLLVKSNDDAKVLLANYVFEKGVKSGKEYRVAVFDKDFNTLWDQKINLDEIGPDVFIKQAEIGNDGKVYLLTMIRPNDFGVKYSDVLPDFTYNLLIIENGEISQLKIEKDERFEKFGDAAIKLLDENQFIISGLYSKKPIENKIVGYFSIFGSGNELGELQLNQFSSDAISSYKNDYLAPIFLHKLAFNNVRDIIASKDGSYMLITEFERYMKITKKDNTTESFTEFGSILIPHFSAEGKNLGTQVISKYYRYTNRSIGPFYMQLLDNELQFVFNDNKLLPKNTGAIKNSLNELWSTDLVNINLETMEITRTENIAEFKDFEIKLVPNTSLRNDGKMVVFGTESMNTYYFGVIEI